MKYFTKYTPKILSIKFNLIITFLFILWGSPSGAEASDFKAISRQNVAQIIITSEKNNNYIGDNENPTIVYHNTIISSKNIEVPRVAILLPLSGKYKKLGQSMLNAAQLALFHFADKNFELLPLDTKGTINGARVAGATAIREDAELILGPVFNTAVKAIESMTSQSGITVLAFSSDYTVAGNNIFTMGFLPSEQVRRIVKFSIEKGIRRFALIAPNNNYGQAVYSALRSTVNLYGATLTSEVLYDINTKNFSPIIRRLANFDMRQRMLTQEKSQLLNQNNNVAKKALLALNGVQTIGELPFDALLIADGGERLRSIAALLPHYDLDPKKVKMLGTGQWDTGGLGSEPALLGGWFSSPSSQGRREFVIRYENIYGETPHRLATLAYDATALAAVFAQSNKDDRQIKLPSKTQFFRNMNITSPRGFLGLDGIFRFSKKGYVERGLAVFEIKMRGTKLISPAPQNFFSQDKE